MKRKLLTVSRAALALAAALAAVPALRAQDRVISLGVKWLTVSDLHSTFAIEGAEFEMHRTGNLPEQCDGLRWPAQIRYQDCWAAKGMWIGCTNYPDPVSGLTYPYKVVSAGPRQVFPRTEIMPVSFKLIGRFPAPDVTVDNMDASTIRINDRVDSYDPSLPADRMIVHVLNTSAGLTLTRRMMSFTNQNHSNYFVYEYVLKNTGIVNLAGDKVEGIRTGVLLHLLYRYAIANEGFKRGWGVSGNASWGRNTVNQTVGTDPLAPDFRFRAQYAWYGPHSASAAEGFDDWGAPDWRVSGVMGAARMAGVVTLHADTSPSDTTDDRTQPRCTQFIGSDTGPVSLNQYDPALMARKYVDYMTSGHPAQTQADQVGDGYADQWGSDMGGFSAGQAFGPWDLAPGDSVRVVVAEGVAGLDRKTNLEVGGNWFRHWKGTSSEAMTLPDGNTTTDFNAYKKAWVLTAKDSLFQTFDRALQNYGSGYAVPQPPPPPERFAVRSGGDRIFLEWADNAAAAPHFGGYRLYRAVGKPDTLYEMIREWGAADAVHSFEDMTAQRGINHYYYISTKDDGTQNDLAPGVPLESSKFYTMTAEPAFLMRPAEPTYADFKKNIRIVPNPYHINATSIQFGDEQPDQISFFGLPPKCTIRIFTERGDLVRTLHHTNTSGDEKWDCTTEYRQIVVSGLYVAHFEVTEDVVDETTGAAVYRKGDSLYKKFIIIR